MMAQLGVICSLAWVWAGSRNLVSLRDEDFVGEDTVLAAELSRRIPPPPEDLNFINFSKVHLDADDDFDDTWDQNLSLNETRRQYWIDPYQKQVEALAMKMMEQSVAATERRLRAFEPGMKKYDKDPLFKLAYAFKLLDQWELDLWYQWSFTENFTRYPPSVFKIHRHIVYYTHAVRRFLDVTYTKEFILELDENITKYNLG